MTVGRGLLCVHVGRLTQRNQQHWIKGEGGSKDVLRTQGYGKGLLVVFAALEMQEFPLVRGKIAPHVNCD